MTQQSAIVLQNRWRPETSRVKSKQEGNKKVQGGSRVSGDTGITFCMSIQIHAQCCWSSWSEATCIFACFCFISHLTLCAIDRGFRLCHLCSYEIYISNDKTPKLCETTLSKRKYWKYAVKSWIALLPNLSSWKASQRDFSHSSLGWPKIRQQGNSANSAGHTGNHQGHGVFILQFLIGQNNEMYRVDCG